MPQDHSRSLISLLLSPLGSIPYILVRPQLFLLTLGPILINILLFAALFGLFTWILALPLGGRIDTGFHETIDGGIRLIARIFLIGFSLLVSLVVCYFAASIIGSPFYNRMSEHTERECLHAFPHLKAVKSDQRGRWIILRMMRNAVARLARVLPIYLILFAIALIPIIGPPVATILGFIKTSSFLALDSYSYAMDRRGMGNREKLNWLRKHPKSTMGVGAGLLLMLILPCMIILIPSLGVVAATREYCRHLIREEQRRALPPSK
ncbi:MAG: EI24 domain-containing protein [Candidatus Sumerlaeia bacterium]|nr:EI24 domain-containing protein [Candidatus Sumerlaeia bacterium]